MSNAPNRFVNELNRLSLFWRVLLGTDVCVAALVLCLAFLRLIAPSYMLLVAPSHLSLMVSIFFTSQGLAIGVIGMTKEAATYRADKVEMASFPYFRTAFELLLTGLAFGIISYSTWGYSPTRSYPPPGWEEIRGEP